MVRPNECKINIFNRAKSHQCYLVESNIYMLHEKKKNCCFFKCKIFFAYIEEYYCDFILGIVTVSSGVDKN